MQGIMFVFLCNAACAETRPQSQPHSIDFFPNKGGMRKYVTIAVWSYEPMQVNLWCGIVYRYCVNVQVV